MGVSTQPNGSFVVKPLGERLASALRDSVGLGLPGGMPPKQLARDLGVDVKTVYGWMAGLGIRGEHLVALFERMPATFAHIVLSGTGCQIVKLGDVRKQVSALRIALQAIEDDAALAEIIGREQDVAHATEGRAVRRGDDAGRGRVVPVLAEGSGSRDGVVAPAAPHGRRRP